MGSCIGSNLADFRPIISFDLATETFGEVDRPNVDYSFTNLGTLEGKLCLIYDIYLSDSKEVWFTKKNGESRASWTKILSISHDIFAGPLTAAVSIFPKGEFLV